MRHNTFKTTSKPIATLFSDYGMGLPVSERELDRAVDRLAAMKAASPSDPALEVMARYVGTKLREAFQQDWAAAMGIQ